MDTVSKSDTATAGEANWQPITPFAPKRGEVVMTRIDDGNGPPRNEGKLFRGNGILWFVPSGAMYVYYTPTHYIPNEAPDGNGK